MAKLMVKLTEEQRNLLILLGKPDDGSQRHLVVDGERIVHDLAKMGLVQCTEKNSYDLTDEGERPYGELTDDDVS